VEIEITQCGVRHSDRHLIDNDWQTSQYPLVPGHEVVGTVARKGPLVMHLDLGARVGVGWQCGSCLQCEWCERGDENLCERIVETCVGRHGGFADRIRVDGRFAFSIPDSLSSEVAAPLLCGGITVYSPLRRYARPQSRAGIVGIGGLGHLAEPVSIHTGMLMARSRSVTSSPTGGRFQMREMLDFAARHGVGAQVETLPMSQVNTALDRLRRNDVRYRFVLRRD
jgi:D-arabinose 1-dehydrogenase-like Zn-dependent alcohol dehydrogenase